MKHALTGTINQTLHGHSGSIAAIAISLDSKILASAGYDKTVRLWNLAKGECISILRGHTGSVTALAFSSNDRRIISGSSDGTSRIWNVNTGDEIGQFIGVGRDDWLIVTPEGYYNSSESGAHFVNVRIGTEIHTMDQFYDAFYHPDLLEAKLHDQSLLTHPSLFTINQTLHSPPPRVSISSPSDNSTSTEQSIEIKTRIEDEGGGIGRFRVYHNGKLINSDETLDVVRQAGGQTSAERRSVERKFSISLVHGNNTVTIIAFNSQNTVMSASKTISVWGDVPLRPPALFVLAVGNAHFTKRSMNLRRPIDDAQDVAELFRTSFSFAFREVTVKTLTDITKPQMVATIRRMTTTIRPEDVFVLFLATHGKASNDVYYAYMSDFGGDIRSQSSSLSSLELMQISKTIPALRQLFIFDTCEAGGVEPVVSGLYDTRISVLAHSAGLHVFAGSKTFQDAQDDFEGNGLFTHFLLAGLRGLADTEGAGNVTVHELGSFLAKTVTGASLGRQQPFIRSFGEDFPLTTTSSSLALFRPAPSGASTQKRPASRRTDTMEDSRGGERISEITLLVGSAKRLYELAHFRQALQICERVLSLDPQNREAIELRNRILETMRVLGEN